MLQLKARWDRLAIVYLLAALVLLALGCITAAPLHAVWFMIGACLLGAFFPLAIGFYLAKGFLGIE